MERERIIEINRCIFPEFVLTDEAVKALVQLSSKFKNDAEAIDKRISKINPYKEDIKYTEYLIEEILRSVLSISKKDWKKYTVTDDTFVTTISLNALNIGVKKNKHMNEILQKKSIEDFVNIYLPELI